MKYIKIFEEFENLQHELKKLLPTEDEFEKLIQTRLITEDFNNQLIKNGALPLIISNLVSGIYDLGFNKIGLLSNIQSKIYFEKSAVGLQKLKEILTDDNIENVIEHTPELGDFTEDKHFISTLLTLELHLAYLPKDGTSYYALVFDSKLDVSYDTFKKYQIPFENYITLDTLNKEQVTNFVIDSLIKLTYNISKEL